jgi:hypothetical protein
VVVALQSLKPVGKTLTGAALIDVYRCLLDVADKGTLSLRSQAVKLVPRIARLSAKVSTDPYK